MAQAQTLKNHTRFDPVFHFFVLPILFLNIPATILWYAHHYYQHIHSGIMLVLVSIALLVLAMKTRIYALANQDRVIRLEEQLRLADLVQEKDLGLVDAVTIKQYVALRFASNKELPALAKRAVTEKLDAKQIKESIVSWRADNDRI